MVATTKFYGRAPMTESFPVSRPLGCPFDPAREYADFRRTAELTRVSTPAGVEAYVASRYDDVRTLLRDNRLSSRVGTVGPHGSGCRPGPGGGVRLDPARRRCGTQTVAAAAGHRVRDEADGGDATTDRRDDRNAARRDADRRWAGGSGA